MEVFGVYLWCYWLEVLIFVQTIFLNTVPGAMDVTFIFSFLSNISQDANHLYQLNTVV